MAVLPLARGEASRTLPKTNMTKKRIVLADTLQPSELLKVKSILRVARDTLSGMSPRLVPKEARSFGMIGISVFAGEYSTMDNHIMSASAQLDDGERLTVALACIIRRACGGSRHLPRSIVQILKRRSPRARVSRRALFSPAIESLLLPNVADGLSPPVNNRVVLDKVRRGRSSNDWWWLR